MKPGETPAQARERLIREASATLIAIADDYSESLVDVIGEVERYDPDRREYYLVNGRLHERIKENR